ncbi:MAG: hypothetical protein QOG67_1071 [Verrucomicrobiota bacterium]|jgi:phosphinothricin acetyltransferase
MSAVVGENPASPPAAAGQMKIRDAVPDDLAALVAIYNAAIATRISTAQLEPVTVESRRDWLKDHTATRHPFWVMENDGQVAGWLTIKPFVQRSAYDGTVELSVYVDERFRRRGVGRALLEEAIARAPSLGIKAMLGLIFAHNEPSVRLFASLGFVSWGMLPRVAILEGQERDLTIMGRHA